MKSWILIAEKQESLRAPFLVFVRDYDIGIRCVRTIEEAINTFGQYEFCLVVLDLGQVNNDSIKIVQQMQQKRPAPILAITAGLEPRQKAELFHAGVQAHIEKPIDMDVCIAQAAALLQIHRNYQSQDQRDYLDFGMKLIIVPCFRQVFSCGKQLELTRKEFDLLCFLARHPFRVYSCEQLYIHVWKERYVSEALFKIIKGIYLKAKKDKKMGQIDRTYMKQAEKMLYGELATALGIPFSEVVPYIEHAMVSTKA